MVYLSVLLILCALFFVLLRTNRHQADEVANSKIYKGKVTMGWDSTEPAAGAKVQLATDSEACETKNYNTVADENGDFEISINYPVCSCPYKIIAGGNDDYNAVDNGSISLNSQEEMPGENGFVVLTTNKIVQAMHSAYFGSVYTEGYYGNFHLSQWDTHFFRNRVTTDQILKPQAPNSASFALGLNGFLIPGEPGMDKTVDIVLTAYPALDAGWQRSYAFPAFQQVSDTKKIQLNTDTRKITGDLNFSFDFSGMTPEQKHAASINGFMIKFGFDTTDPVLLQRWSRYNPDILLPLKGPEINYSGSIDVTANSEFSVTNDPVPSKEITCDYGYRTIGQFCHDGIDLSAGNGTTVRSVAPGKVTEIGRRPGSGICIAVTHCGNMTSVYCHIEKATVSVGAFVKGGDQIAVSDSTGTRDAHLHFMIEKKGVPQDPWVWFPGWKFPEKTKACYNKGDTPEERKASLEGSCIKKHGWEVGY